MSNEQTVSVIEEIANNVAAALAEYGAEVVFAPDFELHQLSTRRVLVVPAGRETSNLSRSAVQADYVIEVGILYREKSMNVGEQLAIVEAITKSIQRKKFGQYTCVKTSNDPLYDVERLRTHNQFTSVVSFTFRISEAV